MKEKIMELFQSEKIRKFNKRVFNKKNIISAIVVIVIVAALKIGFSLIFEVQGTVSKVDGSKITVSNFLTTQTVDVGNYPVTGIQTGDRIEIKKNLSGQVYAVRDNNIGHMDGNKNQGFRGNGEHNSKKKH